MPNNQVEVDKLLLEGRKRLSMTGVDSVDGFTDKILNLTVSGNKVKISGEDIKITAYNKMSKTLSVDGVFNEIMYNSKKAHIMKRIFK
jgi:hypothetical protein